MRVAHVTSYRPDSANGVHAAAAKLGAALVEQGVDVDFWHFRRGIDRVSERDEPSGIHVVELPFPGPSGYLRWLPAGSRGWLRRRAPHVSFVHFHSIFQPEAWYVARLVARPYVLSPHGGYIHFSRGGWRGWARRPAWLLLERDLLRRAAVVHAVSVPDADAVRRLSATSPVVVLPNGVDVPDDFPDPITRESPWLFVGRLAVADKGLDLLIDGYAEAMQRTQLPRLIVRGPDYRGGARWLARRVRDRGISSRVEIGDAVFGEEKAALIASCGLFVHTSRAEGFPIGPLEAMAHARPVVITPGTNLADPVTRAGAGLLVPGHTAADVAETLVRATTMETTALFECGARGRELVRHAYSWSSVAAELAACYAGRAPAARAA